MSSSGFQDHGLPRTHSRSGLVGGLLLVLLGACGGDPESPRGSGSTPASTQESRVLLISLDTLRADACSLYGYERATTPFLEELAALDRTVVFDNHMANSNNTLISHASILTGLFMPAHDTWDKGGGNRSVLHPGFETVVEVFDAAGFDTAAFTSHAVWLTEEYGFGQGFDVFNTEWRNAPETNEEFLEWFDAIEPTAMFAFLHYFDAHSESSNKTAGTLPYEAPEEYLERIAPPRPADFTGAVVTGKKKRWASDYLRYYDRADRDFPPGHLEYVRGCYDAGIAKLDADLRDLFGELASRGVLDSMTIVITSDHGEEFKEHDRLLHGSYHDEIMHVPLMVLLPGGVDRGIDRVSAMTRSVDIAPTLLELTGLPPMADCQGVSLVPTLTTGTVPSIDLSLFGMGITRGIDEVGEYVFNGTPKAYRFFDQASDPDHRTNLYQADTKMPPERILRISRANQRLSDSRSSSQGILKLAQGRADAVAPQARDLEDEAALKSLGYLEDGDDEDGGPDSDAD